MYFVSSSFLLVSESRIWYNKFCCICNRWDQENECGHGKVPEMGDKIEADKNMNGIRLNKFISEAGFCSRREADRLIEQRRVTIDGQAAQMGSRVQAGQTVKIDGRPLKKERERILLAVNKPRGVVCTTDKKWGDQTVDDLICYPKRVFSIGRLDKESEGLLLMTNQGDILNKILKAGNAHEKEYLVTVDKKITEDFLKKMAKGVYLPELEVTTKPCRVMLAGEKRFRIILTQGLNRQIRRMCEALHYQVTKLVRVRIMNIELGDLPSGSCRSVTKKEYAELMNRLRDSSNHPGGYQQQKHVKTGRNRRLNESEN